MSRFYNLAFILFFYISVAGQVNPAVGIISSSSVVCTDYAVSYTVSTGSTPTAYSWSVFPTKDVITSSSTGSLFSVIFPKDLTYTISVTVDVDGPQSFTRRVPVSRTARAAFNAELSGAGYPNELQLTNYSAYSFKNYWRFSDVTAVDSSNSTVKQYSGSGNYSVTLIAIGARGCSDTSMYAFRISDSSALQMPNVFTPNRDDVNDVFKPVATGISELSGWIYTREGILLYHWERVNGFWDGRTSSGELCVTGQYFAIVEARGFDGKIYKLKGPVTLIR